MCTIIHVAPILVPGLLQTHDYCRAVLIGMEVDEIDKRVGMRLGRQSVITKSARPPAYTVFVSEHALREPIGGFDVLVE